MEFRHLQYFVTVAHKLNFSRAAEELRVAQPAISQQIRALEDELGVPLFDRLGRRVALTRVGEALLPHAERILAAVQAAQIEVRELSGLERGSASLGAPPTVASHLLPAQLTRFRERHPGLEVLLREAGTDTLLQLILAGTLDLAIVVIDLLPPSVEVAPLLEEPYLLAVSDQHALGQAASVRLSELATEPFILFPEGYKLREVTLQACRRAGFRPRLALDGGGLQSALEFVAAGLGVAVVPELALRQAQHVRGLPIADQDLRRTLGVAWRRGHYLSAAARALKDFLMEL